MKQHIAFPSIEQFRSVVKLVKDRSEWHQIQLPILDFVGTVKLHGTNAAVCASHDDFWCQSRSNIITFEKDNAGFAAHVKRFQADFENLILSAKFVHGSEKITPTTVVCVYGEWCGQGIQKNVGISGLPKMFVVFEIRVFDTETKETQWLTREQIEDVFVACSERNAESNIRRICEFPVFNLTIDFNKPELAQNVLGQITTEVESSCPVSKALGVEGIGEGVVWKCVSKPDGLNTDGFIFKVKGQEHSVSKVKVLASVDIERIDSVNALVESMVTDNRCEQALDVALKQQGLDVDIKNTGVFLKWVCTDIFKEEADTIVGNGFTSKDVMGAVNKKAKTWFLTYLNENLISKQEVAESL